MVSQKGLEVTRPKRKVTVSTIEVKKELIAKHESGSRVADLSAMYKLPKSTVCTILKNKEAIKAANVAKGVTTLTPRRSHVIEEMETLLLVWINEKHLAGDIISEKMICEKAKQLHSDLKKCAPGTSAKIEEFKGSRGWFTKFKKRTGIHSVLIHTLGKLRRGTNSRLHWKDSSPEVTPLSNCNPSLPLQPPETSPLPTKYTGKVVEILCFDGQQYRYIYRGSDSVCNIKLELQGGVDIFVYMEDFNKLEPADLKPGSDKLFELIVPDVTMDASPEEILPSPKPMLPGLLDMIVPDATNDENPEEIVLSPKLLVSELCVKEETSTFQFSDIGFVDQESNSDIESMEDYGKVVPEPCTDFHGTKKRQHQSHQAVHPHELPFRCHLCSKAFKNEVHFEQHVTTHSDKKSFSCTDCGKSFRQNDDFKTHQREVHNKETPFNCDMCVQGFVTTQVLKNHLQTVHNEKTFECEKDWTPGLTNS